MFDLNGVCMKGPEDLQKALRVEHDVDTFVSNIGHLIQRYGVENALETLGQALLGTVDGDVKPMIKFTHRLVPPPEGSYDDPQLEEIK